MIYKKVLNGLRKEVGKEVLDEEWKGKDRAVLYEKRIEEKARSV
jgi:hypothetical protein